MRIFLILFVGSFGLVSLQAEDHWNQFRGPNGDGKSLAVGLAVEFGEAQNVRWKTPIHGKGFSSPVVWGDQIWLTTAPPDGKKLYAVAVDLDSGEIIYDLKLFDVPEPQRGVVDNNSYASPTAVVEEGRVYVHFGTAGTVCLDTHTGDKLWERRDFHCDHETRPAASPIIYGDTLFVAYDGIDVQYVVALDKHTGKTVWKRDRGLVFSKPGYWDNKDFTTAKLIEHQGRRQLISPMAKVAISYDPETGEELWRIWHGGANSGCRPLYEHGLVYISGGSNDARLVAVKPSGTGDVTDTHIVWSTGKSTPNYASQVIVDDLLFMVDDGGVASCLDAKSGELVWKGRLGGDYWASPLAAGGKVYFFSKQGDVSVISASREFELLAKNNFASGFTASAAVAGSALILRTQTHLYYITE